MLASSLSAIVGARWVKVRRPELAPYDADGLPVEAREADDEVLRVVGVDLEEGVAVGGGAAGHERRTDRRRV